MIELQNRILALVNSGQLNTARNECLSACNQTPENAQLWFMMSAICGQMQDFKAAEEYCLKAIQLDAEVASAYYNLAIAQRRQGKIDEAFTSLEKATQLQADFTAAQFELGNICLEIKDYTRAIQFYQQVLTTAPDAYQAYTGIAIAQDCLGEYDAAIASSLESLRINNAQQELVLRLAGLYNSKNQPDKALEYYGRAISLGHNSDDVYVNLARMHSLLGDDTAAEKAYIQALEINPSSREALSNLAIIYEDKQDVTRALKYIEQAYLLYDDDQIVAYNYAKILTTLRRYSDAERLYESILIKNPDFSRAEMNLGNLYLLSGKATKAQKMYQKACSNEPDFHDACSNMLMSLNYTDNFSDKEIFKRHLSWAQRIESEICPIEHLTRDKHYKDKVKIGYVSPDFRNHSVAFFFEGILKHSDKQRFETFCYSDVKHKDDVTEMLYTYCDIWRDVFSLDDASLADLINHDGIDILVDLCGHMSGNRLPVFAMKPAIVQVTYLGYPNTTGLSAMDYRIVDAHTDPVGPSTMMSEQPLYLDPCFLSFTPERNNPDVSELPALENGYITFGSFNNLAKITDEVVREWSDILNKVAGSVLCIKARQFEDVIIKEEFARRFKDTGIDSSRLRLISYSKTIFEHLQTYNHIDIALDTFPYNGTTTSIEALLMGVPVICLRGHNHASRVGASILSTLEMDDFIADDSLQYVEIAEMLAKDTENLSILRSQLRSRMKASSLLDTKSFTKKYESTLLTIVAPDQN